MPEQTSDAENSLYASFATKASWVVNWFLFFGKLLCVIFSGSKSIVAALADSAVDLLSQAVLSLAEHKMASDSPFYPIGRARLEALAVLCCAGIMIAVNVEVIQFSIVDIVQGLSGQIAYIDLSPTVYSILSIGIFLKFALFIYCRWASTILSSDLLDALAEDHFNDVFSNIAALITASIAFNLRKAWWVDPAGAILISLIIVGRWFQIISEQTKKIVGHTAPPEIMEEIEKLAQEHDTRLQLDCTRAYHFGSKYNVEMEIVLPGTMSVAESHDIASSLRDKIEALDYVERALIHVDHQMRDGLEHKIERNLATSPTNKSTPSTKLIESSSTPSDQGKYIHPLDIETPHTSPQIIPSQDPADAPPLNGHSSILMYPISCFQDSLGNEEKAAMLASWVVNLLLLAGKLICVIISNSKAVTATFTDSVVDIISQCIFQLIHFFMNHWSESYPIGRSRLEALGILICAFIMIFANIEIIQFSIEDLQAGISQNIPEIHLNTVVYSILVIGIFLKFFLYLFCRAAGSMKRSDLLKALAEDHFNDIFSNIAALIAVTIAFNINKVWWIDPTGAILIALVIIWRWIQIISEQNKKVVGHTAPPEKIEEIEKLAQEHDTRLQVDCTRAYHFGSKYNVEMEIVLPGTMSVAESHDIALLLQHKIESLEDIERAFVHVDYQKRDGLQHKVERELAELASEAIKKEREMAKEIKNLKEELKAYQEREKKLLETQQELELTIKNFMDGTTNPLN